MTKAYLQPTLSDPKIVEINGSLGEDQFGQYVYTTNRGIDRIGKHCYLTRSEALAAGLTTLDEREATARKQLEKISKLRAKLKAQLDEMEVGNAG
jgi:hypothetical protein